MAGTLYEKRLVSHQAWKQETVQQATELKPQLKAAAQTSTGKARE